MSSLRDTINRGDANQLAPAISQARLADIIAMLVAASTATEAAAAVTSSALTLANAPAPSNGLLHVVATAAGVTGRKTIILDATGRYQPATGEVAWNGGTGLRFSAADAVTAASAWYIRNDRVGSIISGFERPLGDRGVSGIAAQ